MGKILTRTPNQPTYASVRGADYVIAASDSPASWKSQASTVCSGTADEEQINYYAEKMTSGGLLLLAPGTFHVEADDSIHHLTSKTIFRGCGRLTKIIKDSLGTSTNLIRIIGALSDITIEDMYLDINDAAATCQFINATSVTGLTANRVYMYGGSNKQGRVFIQDSINVRVLFCEMSYAERMQFGDSNDAAKDDTALTAKDTLVMGCRLTNMDATDMAIGCLVVDPRIIGNFVDTGGEGIDVSWSPYAVVEGNTVLNCAMVGLYGESGREQVFANNTVSGCAYGIGLMNIQHIATTTCGKAIIVGNTIRNTTTHGIQVHGQPRVTIAENTITDCGGNGIYLTYHDSTTYESHDCIIANNTIFNFGTITATSAGINAKYADGTRITGNLVDGNNAVEADRGINDDGTSDNCVVENNTIRNINGNNHISMTGSGHYIRGNQGYIAKGERRTAGKTLTAAAKDAVAFYWNNPEKQDILVKEVMIDITTSASGGGALADIGIADSSSGTALGTEFFNDLSLDATGIHIADTATLCENSTNATDAYIVGLIGTADATQLVGSYHITYVGR